MSQTPNRRTSNRPKKDELRLSKTDPAPLRTPKVKPIKEPKPKPSRSSPKGNQSQITQIKKESGAEAPMTPPKPGSSQLKLSISNTEINLEQSEPKSALEALDSTSGSNSSRDSNNDTLDKISEIHAEEFEMGEPSVPLIQIPDDIRLEAGHQWRLKEAIMNSFHFGKASIRASEFARSDSDLKTAEVVASDAHTLDSKKFRVKLHLGTSDFFIIRMI